MNGQGNARVRREAKRRGPLVNENTKKALFMKGPKTSDVVVHAMKDLHTLKAHDGKLFSRKNDIRPFEDTQSLEFLCQKNDTSLFCVASHTKKRPMTLTLGRLFNWSVLDVFEISLTQYVDRVCRQASGPQAAAETTTPERQRFRPLPIAPRLPRVRLLRLPTFFFSFFRCTFLLCLLFFSKGTAPWRASTRSGPC
jgi:hypothetical protein